MIFFIILAWLLLFIILFFIYTFYKFLRYRKSLIEDINEKFNDYFAKLGIPNDDINFINSLNFESLNNDFSYKQLYIWINKDTLNFANTDFQMDLGIISIPINNIDGYEIKTYKHSDKSDIYLYYNDGSSKILYLKEDSYNTLKKLLPNKELVIK
ncbi:hypothetical protein [Oceanirhabdus sp. W0125-5]|uniref:hypothetical protein n=1 Tax=Oceanirhabdus sp. W0125-5 TaxID=2999116 RepID=UPI0022F2E08D|nr:hypothetical protein [Oceanirhabdus sp. W0125-5]WBW99662.1 hypothetical protein OW730_13205 [Oceanirhabdus sp. W0125-5]